MFQFATISYGDITLNLSKDDDGSSLDITDNVGVFTARKIALGIDFALDSAIDEQIAGEAELAFNLHIVGEDILVACEGGRGA